MNSGQRTAVSLLVSVALFTAFIFTVYTSVFEKIETKFYEPEKISLEKGRIKESAEFCDTYIQNLLTKTGAYAANPVVLTYLNQTPTESEVTERVRLSGELFVSLPALDGFRFLDKNGRNVHYSSYAGDITKQQGTTKVYKNYTDIEKIAGESPFALINIEESESIPPYRLTFNKTKTFINITVPVFDSYNILKGFFVFYFKTPDLERELIKAGHISVGESIALFIAEDELSAGVVTGLPNVGKELFTEPVLNAWNEKVEGPANVLKTESEDNEKKWVVLSDYTSAYLSFSEIYTSDYFILPETIRYLVLVCVFITLFLIMFLLFSFKIDDMVIIRSRIKKIQFAFVTEYLNNKDSVDWEQLNRQIESRREDLFRDVKKSLGRKGRKHEKQVDALLNKSWNEILSAIGTRSSYENQIAANGASSAELKKMLEEVLSSSEIKVKAVAAPVETVETIEPVETVDPIESVEEIDEVETVEEVEELGDVDAVEEPEAVEELDAAEAVDEVETVDDLDEVEAVEEVETVEELDEIEPVEEIDEVEAVEELDEVETDDEVEAVEELDEAEAVDEVEAVEELDEVEPVEEVEELSDAEPVESVEDVEAIEELGEAEPVEEIEEVETVDNLDEVEAVEEVEELGDSEPVEPVEEPEVIEALDEAEPVEELGDEESVEPVELIDTEILESVEDKSADDVVELLADEAEPEAEEIEELPEEENGSDFNGLVVERERDSIFQEPNDTFAVSTEEPFATVDNIFAEELRFGESYIDVPGREKAEELEMPVSFVAADPDFGEEEELLPVSDNKNTFSMTGFGANNNNVVELLSEEEETIVEKDGIYSISSFLETSSVKLDKDFKKLVDAVMR